MVEVSFPFQCFPEIRNFNPCEEPSEIFTLTVTRFAHASSKIRFRFSSDLMAQDDDVSKVPNGASANRSSIAPAGPSTLGQEQSATTTIRSNHVASSSYSSFVEGHCNVLQKDTVASFIARLGEYCSDKILDSLEVHLPCFLGSTRCTVVSSKSTRRYILPQHSHHISIVTMLEATLQTH